MDFFRRRSKALKRPASQAPRQFDKRQAGPDDTAERPRVRGEAEPGDRNSGGVDRTSPTDRS